MSMGSTWSGYIRYSNVLWNYIKTVQKSEELRETVGRKRSGWEQSSELAPQSHGNVGHDRRGTAPQWREDTFFTERHHPPLRDISQNNFSY